jgi:hypothetical protein
MILGLFGVAVGDCADARQLNPKSTAESETSVFMAHNSGMTTKIFTRAKDCSPLEVRPAKERISEGNGAQ